MVTILSYPKEEISTSPIKLFKCFSLQIWLLIAVFFLVYGWLRHVHLTTTTAAAAGSEPDAVTRTSEGWLYDLLLSYTDIYSILVGQG